MANIKFRVASGSLTSSEDFRHPTSRVCGAQKNIPPTVLIFVSSMPCACWIPEATNTHLEYVILINFFDNSGCTYASRRCVTCTLPVLFAVCVSLFIY